VGLAGIKQAPRGDFPVGQGRAPMPA
jgi:hypothetical protein